ncbi:thioredoxin domain-containing protein [Echinicola jeungdonensis]|uniref:Thioredoxin domain-containing protein n=1 Tax=Echinicola jeungdonensis TaxID=709343 RepID=A0ABV5J940_9BACT|nr:thioredoxin domain-containing protein [Echinicola jeungdonensis]MDN3670142.1 thioredoxin domain-containing protein [Echinicola jeungdonensis]
MTAQANKLIHSQSPYLLQHAYNPVEWYPWGKEALERAKKENKPIIVSIGYSACHWCHVMEHESFEDEETARLMNEHFICIKIDREERPDLDNIYMDAVQAMGLNGGWPLNVFLMPNQKPFYGGTYFPNPNWKGLLQNIAEAYEKHYEELAKSAEGFGKSIQRLEKEKYGLQEDKEDLSNKDLAHVVQKIINQTDPKWGGMDRTPKFPMPSIWHFVLDVAQAKDDRKLVEEVIFTLKKMGMGGIYDHLAGGFARYSVDGEWFAPHFEKMLYDNGQLLALFAKAYQISQDPFFAEKVDETVQWIDKEMLQEEGGFYAALDADSEGEEGKFYTWKASELEEIMGMDKNWFFPLYNISEKGNWENGVNILFQTQSYQKLAEMQEIPPHEFTEKVKNMKSQLLERRNQRIRPGLDDKIISGWNGLTISGLSYAHWATGSEKAKELALANGAFLLKKMVQGEELFRSYKNGKAYTSAFLEDYAAVIQAFIHLYQLSFETKWLLKAKSLTEYTLEHFYDEKEGLFYFNNPDAEVLIANKKEIFDNVIPSSNSMMARNIYQLSLYFYEEKYKELSANLMGLMKKLLIQEPGFLTNWGSLYLERLAHTPEIAIVGKGAIKIAGQISKVFPGQKAIAASESPNGDIPLLKHKIADSNGNALIYVCFDETCKKPVSTIEEALSQIPNL